MDINIVIISDRDELHLLENTLAGMQGYNIQIHRSIFDGLFELKKISANLIIVDIEGLESSSNEILHAINQVSPESQIIIVSGSSNGRIPKAHNGNMKLNNGNVICSFSHPLSFDRLSKTIKEYTKKKLPDPIPQQNINQENDSAESRISLIHKDHFYTEKLLKSVSNLEELTDLIVQASTDRVNAEKCSIMLLDEKRQTLAVNKVKGFNGNQSEIKSTKVKLGEGIAGLVALKGESLLVTDISKRKNYQSKYSIRYNSNSFISMPLKVKADTIGVLNLTDKIDNHQFTERDLHSLSAFTSCASIAIKNALMFEELQNLSLTDELTGLYNRRHFYKCLENEMIRSGRFDRHFTLAILDIDNFKYYNDTYGHLAGDSILKQVSEILKTQTRGIDIVARYGGEEFAVIFPETQGTKNSITSTSSGLQFPERLRAAFERHRFLNISTEKKLNLTISGGVAIFPLDGKTAKGLISRADENLYHAKRNGRNKVYVGRVYPSKSDNSTQKNTTISRNSIQKLAARLTARKALSS